MTGLRYAFSSLGSLNSVMSVSHSLFGASAWKLWIGYNKRDSFMRD